MAAALHWPATLAVRLPAAARRPALAAVALVLAVVALGVPPALAAARFAHEDRSADTRVRDLALETLAQAETGAHVYVDWELISVLRYYRYVDHRRLDLDLRSDDPNNWAATIGRDLDAGVPVYVGGFAGADPTGRGAPRLHPRARRPGLPGAGPGSRRDGAAPLSRARRAYSCVYSGKYQ